MLCKNTSLCENHAFMYYYIKKCRTNPEQINQYNYCDTDGNIVLKNWCKDFINFINGATKVKSDNKYGIINLKGEYIVKPIYMTI